MSGSRLTRVHVSRYRRTHPKHLKDTPSSYKCFELSNFKSELNKENSTGIAMFPYIHMPLFISVLKINSLLDKVQLSFKVELSSL